MGYWPGMRRVEAEALVGASRDEVWQLYDDIQGTPLWVPFVSDILYVSGPSKVGTVYRERTRLAGLPTTAQWEIVEHRRPTRQVHLSDAFGMESALIITFEGRGTGTWVHEAAELRSRLWGPLGWMHEALLAVPAGWGVRAAVAGAKRRFEGDPPR
jgi:polyketide cyclase/dehydrase/lipid transport protein